jgi:tryptophan-rich hypothetical protein
MGKQKFPHLLGSKWTARESAFGWRHFQVVNRKNQGELVFAELVATCDPEVRFWINARTLKERRLWQAGWQPKIANTADLERLTDRPETTLENSPVPDNLLAEQPEAG